MKKAIEKKTLRSRAGRPWFSVLFIYIYPGTVSLLTMMVDFISAGADLMIAFQVLKERDGFIADHPTEAGYIVFYR